MVSQEIHFCYLRVEYNNFDSFLIIRPPSRKKFIAHLNDNYLSMFQ